MMKKNCFPLISIIIPIYNVERYLEQCLDSVINQSYKNLEIICVNDFSTDNSLSILNKYAGKDSRIKIVENSNNIGPGLSRNAGIKIATGDYVHCLDPDDWMELNAYQKIAEFIHNIGDIDAIRFSYNSYNEQNGQLEKSTISPQKFFYQKINIYNTPECLRFWNVNTWTKVFKRKFILENNLFYNDYRCAEDVSYSIQSAMKINSMYFIEDCLLYYRVARKDSLSGKRLYYIDNLITDTIWTNQNTENMQESTKLALRNFMYEVLVLNSIDAYYEGIFSYQELKRIYSNYIIFESFKQNIFFNTPYCYKIVEKVLTYNKIKFFISYNMRRYLRTKFPNIAKFYFKMKNKIFSRIISFTQINTENKDI